MNDLKNILNYFGDCWRLERYEGVYNFTWLEDGKQNLLTAKTPEKMAAKIHKKINECAIKKPKKAAKLKGLKSLIEKPDKHFYKSIQGITKAKYPYLNSSETKPVRKKKVKGKK